MIVPVPQLPRVVVVEDDPASRKSLERVLRVGGFEAVLFASAEEYLASVPISSAIGMLLDLQLPGLSGLDLQRHIRSAGSTIPVIVITAHDDAESRAESHRLGCTAYLTKPCDGRTILALLGGRWQ